MHLAYGMHINILEFESYVLNCKVGNEEAYAFTFPVKLAYTLIDFIGQLLCLYLAQCYWPKVDATNLSPPHACL